jgi:hypothetical protein
MDEDLTHRIHSISIALNRLSMINQMSYDKEYNDICSLMKEYIEKNCKHEIIKDYIDISPECSKTIEYCAVCLKNF